MNYGVSVGVSTNIQSVVVLSDPSFNNSDTYAGSQNCPAPWCTVRNWIIRRRRRRRSCWQQRVWVFHVTWYTICDSRIKPILYLLTICSPIPTSALALFSLKRVGDWCSCRYNIYKQASGVCSTTQTEVIYEGSIENGGREKQAHLGELAIGIGVKARGHSVCGWEDVHGEGNEVSQEDRELFWDHLTLFLVVMYCNCSNHIRSVALL